MHVARNRRRYVAKSGEERVYESVLVRRTYRDGGKVRHQTLANLSALPDEVVAVIEAALKGRRHLRKTWGPLTYTDEHPPPRANPVAPAQCSAHARAKASSQHNQLGHPYRSFRGLLDHLATLTRNHTRINGTDTTVPMLAEPTPDQRHAFELIGAPIPTSLT
jgi:hypothetical protein